MEIKKSPKANLENKKILFREIGLIIALAAVLVAFEWKSYERASNLPTDLSAALVEEEMIPITRETPPPPPEVPKAPTVSDIINIVDDDIKIEHELIINTEDNRNIGIDLRDFVVGRQVEENFDDEEEINIIVVEQKPRFRGGDENTFRNWVNDNITYPEVARENGAQGRVTLSFLIDTDGRLTDVSLVRGVDPNLDREAIRVVQLSPRWEPGRQRDKAVKVRYIFHVFFQLN